jgi:hypothetical protein
MRSKGGGSTAERGCYVRWHSDQGDASVTAEWSVSTDLGSSLGADEFVGVLSAHHDRVVGAWLALSPEQWGQPSRNAEWSAHDTARHVADCMELVTAQVHGEESPFPAGPFDPRATPETWLASSADDSPTRTIERFAEAAQRLRVRVGERLAAGDASTGTTVYGPAHWSVNVVHLFWDSWLHERDVLLPLGLPTESTHDEQRLAALYGLLMAMLPAKMTDQSFTASVGFAGPGGVTVTAAHESGRLSSTETSTTDLDLAGELGPLVDSLSGRGTPLREAFPGAPDMLTAFADFMTG